MPVDFVTTYVDYIPNPGSPEPPPSPCTDAAITPQKVCGTLSPPASGETEGLQWVEVNYVNATGAAQAFTSTSTMARRAIVDAPSTNTADVTMGPNSTATLVTMPSGVTGYLIEMPDGTAFDLADWFAKSGAAGQKLNILYLPG